MKGLLIKDFKIDVDAKEFLYHYYCCGMFDINQFARSNFYDWFYNIDFIIIYRQ